MHLYRFSILCLKVAIHSTLDNWTIFISSRLPSMHVYFNGEREISHCQIPSYGDPSFSWLLPSGESQVALIYIGRFSQVLSNVYGHLKGGNLFYTVAWLIVIIFNIKSS